MENFLIVFSSVENKDNDRYSCVCVIGSNHLTIRAISELHRRRISAGVCRGDWSLFSRRKVRQSPKCVPINRSDRLDTWITDIQLWEKCLLLRCLRDRVYESVRITYRHRIAHMSLWNFVSVLYSPPMSHVSSGVGREFGLESRICPAKGYSRARENVAGMFSSSRPQTIHCRDDRLHYRSSRALSDSRRHARPHWFPVEFPRRAGAPLPNAVLDNRHCNQSHPHGGTSVRILRDRDVECVRRSRPLRGEYRNPRESADVEAAWSDERIVFSSVILRDGLRRTRRDSPAIERSSHLHFHNTVESSELAHSVVFLHPRTSAKRNFIAIVRRTISSDRRETQCSCLRTPWLSLHGISEKICYAGSEWDLTSLIKGLAAQTIELQVVCWSWSSEKGS